MSKTKNGVKTRGFRAGYNQIPHGKIKEVKAKIMEALGVNNPVSFSRYKTGKVDMKISQAEAVMAVFENYEIFEVWDS